MNSKRLNIKKKPKLVDTKIGQWTLVDGKLSFLYNKFETFWEMPEGFEIPDVSILNLAEYVLLNPQKIDVNVQSRSAVGGRVAVAFSGGVDLQPQFLS